MKTLILKNIAGGILLVVFLCAFQSTAFAVAPSATTQSASSITTSSAQLNSYVNPNGLATTIYFQYGLTTSYGSSTSLGGIGTAAGNYGFSISSLSANTTYHFRIVAYNSSGTTYGSDLTFTTLANPPSATTQSASSITTSSAQLNSYVNPNGASTTIYYQYGLTSSYGNTTISGNIGTSAGNYGTSISSLSPNTTYHFRIVAYNSGGTSYGSDLTFTTSASAPSATTQAASSIASTSAQLNSYVNPNGASTTIYYQYGLTASYGYTALSGNIGTSAGNYGTTASGLSPNTTYHFRIVAYNNGGTSYGSDLTFTTLASAPAATTQAATSITSTSAQLNSYVDPSGATTTIYYQYGLTTSYGSTTISGNIGTTAGNFGTTASSLTPNTTYHFQIVAYNSGGTTYGSDMTFTTLASAPSATTQAATSVTTSTATLNASVNANGAATTIYFQWGTTTSYGSSSTPGSIGTQNLTLNYPISGLSPNTTYHFQIVASSSGGTTYGSDLTFTTTALAQAPTVSTLAASSVTSVSAQLNASLNPNGSTTTAYFEYGTTTSYGSSSSVGNFGTVSQTISYTIASLTPGTTYHYRLTASNSNGTAHGNDQTFTTTGTSSPTAQTLDATSVTTSTAQLNGSLNPNGISTTAHFEYGLTAAYGSSTASGNFGTTSQNIGYTISGLAPNTTYHFRLDASNTSGPSYGVDKTFTTLPTTTTAQNAWVSGTGGIGLRLRDAPSLSGNILMVMPEGAQVTLLSGTQSANGYLWRNVTCNSQTGWADSEYLVFSPTGTPTPPAAPVTLRQLQSDDISPIAAGGTASSSTVILAATTTGTSSQQFSVQVEVRPTGTAFSNPTATSLAVQGGIEAQIKISNLGNQGYHWRARVLDGNGVPSSWVLFSGNATDFIVNAVTSPLANFIWSPAQVFTGDSITFTAQAAAQSGLTFSWNFGGTQTATGGTVNQTFSQSGNVIVTLTVTDSQNNQSHQSLTVAVASKDLVTRINATAGQSEAMLDDILANATLSAGAADYFKEGVENAPLDIGIQAALTGLSLILGSSDNELDLASRAEDWARQAYGAAAANELAARLAPHFAAGAAIDEIRATFVSWAVGKLSSGGSQSYQQMWMPGLTNYVAQKKTEIEQYRVQAVAAAGSLTQAQSALLVQNLQSRLLGNYALQASYDANANLPISFENYKSTDETGWTTYNIGQHLFSASASLLGTALGGMGGIVAGVAATASQSELDIFNTLASQSAEAQLLSLSLSVAGQGSDLVRQISTNIETGLNDVIMSQSPVSPTGQMSSIAPYSQGTLRTYNLMPRWFATAAYADVVVHNTGQQAATYRVEAFLTKTFTTGQLPVNFLGLGQRQYDIQVATAQDGITLNSGAQQTVRLTFLAGDGGLVPEGQDINYVLTSRTPDGYYRQDSQIQHFGTTYLDENGNVVDPSLIASATVSQPPLQSSLLLMPGTNICELNISVQNPLETPVMLNLGQDIPNGTKVINAAGGTYSNNHLSWQLNLQPGQFQFFQVVLQLTSPVSNPPVTNTTASVYDTVNDAWVQFSLAPMVSQMKSSPPPQIQPAGLIGGSFGLGLQALIPGIYQVQATTNFVNWYPINTVTNAGGSFQIIDPNSQNHSTRFYRVSRQ